MNVTTLQNCFGAEGVVFGVWLQKEEETRSSLQTSCPRSLLSHTCRLLFLTSAAQPDLDQLVKGVKDKTQLWKGLRWMVFRGPGSSH